LSDGITPLVQRQTGEEEDAEELLQTKPAAGNTLEVAPRVASAIAAMKGGGQPLPASERAFFEPRFGQDFSMVRVHTGAEAAAAARAINAHAFTVGRDVVFGGSKDAPASGLARRLLAHELTHVVQQSGMVIPFGVTQMTIPLRSVRSSKTSGTIRSRLQRRQQRPSLPIN
jgi:hypothetical protein